VYSDHVEVIYCLGDLISTDDLSVLVSKLMIAHNQVLHDSTSVVRLESAIPNVVQRVSDKAGWEPATEFRRLDSIGLSAGSQHNTTAGAMLS
jgi:hypothetical protein